MGHLERMGVGGLWGSYIDNDPGNPERYLVHFYNGGLGLRRTRITTPTRSTRMFAKSIHCTFRACWFWPA